MKIAIAGVGGIGKHILDALLKTHHSLCALSRTVWLSFGRQPNE
jgi:CO dehydrogenase nickel-insertion accessory protein CooC1